MKDEQMVVLIERILTVLQKIQSIAEKGIETSITSNEEWLDAVDMKEKVHISRTTLYRWKKEGYLATKRLGKKEYYLLSQVQDNLKNKVLP
jgi:DNA-binding transcriptional regulator PaaX